MKRKKQSTQKDVYVLEKLLQFKYQDTSYKLFWMRGILNELSKNKKNITFDTLGMHMISEAWVYTMQKKIRFTREDRLHRMIERISIDYKIPADLSKEEVFNLLAQINPNDLREIIGELYEDTPYRLFEPLFEKELKNKRDSQKNQWLLQKINENQQLFYTIDEKKGSIEMNEEWVKAFKENIRSVEGIYRDNLAYFLRDCGLGKGIRYTF